MLIAAYFIFQRHRISFPVPFHCPLLSIECSPKIFVCNSVYSIFFFAALTILLLHIVPLHCWMLCLIHWPWHLPGGQLHPSPSPHGFHPSRGESRLHTTSILFLISSSPHRYFHCIQLPCHEQSLHYAPHSILLPPSESLGLLISLCPGYLSIHYDILSLAKTVNVPLFFQQNDYWHSSLPWIIFLNAFTCDDVACSSTLIANYSRLEFLAISHRVWTLTPKILPFDGSHMFLVQPLSSALFEPFS